MNKRIKLSPGKYRKLKEYVFYRDQYCVFCGDPYSATPAHVKRRSQRGNDSPNNLVRACQKCHDAFDQYKIELPANVIEMLSKEPTVF